MAEMRKQLTREDLLLIVLLGHGTYDGDVAKFNLVGPDLTAADWAGTAERAAGPASHRQHHGSELSVPRAAIGPEPRGDHGDRFGGAEIRHGLS